MHWKRPEWTVGDDSRGEEARPEPNAGIATGPLLPPFFCVTTALRNTPSPDHAALVAAHHFSSGGWCILYMGAHWTQHSQRPIQASSQGSTKGPGQGPGPILHQRSRRCSTRGRVFCRNHLNNGPFDCLFGHQVCGLWQSYRACAAWAG